MFGVLFVVLIGYIFALPDKLFDVPYSTIIEDRDGSLLSASTAADGQWRFPQQQPVPSKFKVALVNFEDKRFNSHIGVDVRALARATRQNIKARKIVSGGSTITMQAIRLSRKNPSRTFSEKLLEIILATRLEWRYTKEEILQLYAAHAPFGGNVVGLDAACWRYFGRGPEELSWAEASLLAVLPNNPALIHPGKNRGQLKSKRDRLLQRLFRAGEFDSLTLNLSIAEPIPDEPKPLPRLASHLLSELIKKGESQKRTITTLNEKYQLRASQILNDHLSRLTSKQVFNAAAIIADVNSGQVLAYIGNLNSGDEHQDKVNVISATRSTGSILKPVLYAAMLDEGKILPHTLLPDVPSVINGFAPKNFSKGYDGAVAADQALIRSLNLPAVHLLREFRYEKFYELLKSAGLSTLSRPPDHYGLSLILGGADATLWDVTSIYASMARTLNRYFERPGSQRYAKSDFHPLTFQQNEFEETELSNSSWISAGAAFQTFEELKDVYRPGEETGWQLFNTSKRIAWKTGTSHGHRDAWAVGVTPEFVVGVWVGNADGEGRPGLTGTEMAAPILFDIFSSLPGNMWFSKPQSEFSNVAICRASGQRAGEHCPEIVEEDILLVGLNSPGCGFHRIIHLTKDERFRVHADCESLTNIKPTIWFVLPAIQEYYFRQKSLDYKTLPPLRPDCANPQTLSTFDLIYPKTNAQLFLPRNLDGTSGSAVFEAVHRNPATQIHWHLDGNFIGTTQKTHKMPISVGRGNHTITLVDDQGEALERKFLVIFGS